MINKLTNISVHFLTYKQTTVRVLLATSMSGSANFINAFTKGTGLISAACKLNFSSLSQPSSAPPVAH